MKKAFFIVFVSALIYACGGASTEENGSGNSGSSSMASSETAAAAASSADGQKIYRQYCVACHGIYGDMGASGAFNLTTSELSVDERVQVITKGRVGASGAAMQSFEALLEPEEIQAVAEYTMTLTEDHQQ